MCKICEPGGADNGARPCILWMIKTCLLAGADPENIETGGRKRYKISDQNGGAPINCEQGALVHYGT